MGGFCLAEVSRHPTAQPNDGRPEVSGKFLSAGGVKLSVRGATYGPFGPAGSEAEYRRADADHDFAMMAKMGFTALRTYTAPPIWLLDAAYRHGLWVMAGVSWEQHVTFLDRPELCRSITQRVKAAVRESNGHPAVLCYAIGNEIPAPIVRWHGAGRIARFLHHLYDAAKEVDSGSLVTYVNYPGTEYLRLPFLDLVSFNVYLHSHSRLAAYLARLHNLAGERPLLMGEIGLDSLRHGEEAQAEALRQQIRVTIEGGCVGSFVFSWTDEWHRGGFDIRDWQFGLTRRDRSAKPALLAAATTFSTDSGGPVWPRISVVVCVYNGEKQIAECLSALEVVDYPDYEVIVVDDGSTDNTAAIAGRFRVRIVSTENRGLSAARNVGLSSATGEIIAYIDGDAYPEPEWLKRLAVVFLKTDYIGVGGPNIPPPSDPPVAQCVARAPGGPIHVLISDTEAEHIPGCNMAFRRAALLEICGFDPQFRVAGDDVDICWRLQERGWKLGFSPTAVVFHHRRDSLRAYWKQQAGYGKAEGMLERKFPAKYNGTGHLTWAGRIYNAKGLIPLFWRRGRIYQGTLGMAPFQLLYQPASGFLSELGLIPEWYLVIAFLAALAVVGVIFKLRIWIDLLFVPALTCSIAQAIMSARIAASTLDARARMTRMKYFGILAVLHLLQPLARLYGRLGSGLHPWRVSGGSRITFPRPRTLELWSETWKAPQEWLSRLQCHILSDGVAAVIGGDYDQWDLQIRRGILAGARTKIVVEEHGGGRQMLRFRLWPHCTATGLSTAGLLAGMALAAGVEHAWPAVSLLAGIGLIILGRIMHECALLSEKLTQAIRLFADPEVIPPRSSKVIAVRAAGEGC